MNFGAVSCNPGGVGTPVAKAIVAPDFILPSAYNTFDRLSIVNANSATASFTVTTSNGTFETAPFKRHLSNGTFETAPFKRHLHRTGEPMLKRDVYLSRDTRDNTNCSMRTGNVTITNPAAPVASSSASTIAYSTSATAVPRTLSGTLTSSITITQ